jgi:hypothetical protein
MWRMRSRLTRLALAVFAIAVTVLAINCRRAPAPVQRPVGVVVVANQEKGVATLIEVQSGRVIAHIDVDSLTVSRLIDVGEGADGIVFVRR